VNSQSIHVAAVRDPRHVDSFRGIVDGVDNPVITNPDSPTVFIAVKLFASRRSRVIGEATYFGRMRSMTSGVKSRNSLFADEAKVISYIVT